MKPDLDKTSPGRNKLDWPVLGGTRPRRMANTLVPKKKRHERSRWHAPCTGMGEADPVGFSNPS
jgi:hypothetical protein